MVSRLRDAGCVVRVLTRRARPAEGGVEFVTGDLASGQGVERAVAGAETIVHCASSYRGDPGAARHLVQAASRAGRPHLVYISIVGVDRIPISSPIDRAMFGYYESKRLTERVVTDSGLPWTTLRSTQFHDLILKVAQVLARSPVMPVPAGFRAQPIEADEVAARLVELALATPAGRVPDMAGPRVYAAADLFHGYLRAARRRGIVVPLPVPGKAARAFRDGANLAPEQAVGRRTWEEFLTDRVR
ncbi:SDR family oxidoreductase [Micromonospora sp. IBHARD004]|uniref:SDR family oxidoreductase n=1 Tax=Micromonospora sp. IBHARD004 TaxID=3457764 RepID=UPI0040583B15